MRIKGICRIATAATAALAVVLMSSVRAQPKGISGPTADDLHRLSWLTGTWREVDSDHPTEEHWGAPEKDTMMGMCRLGSMGGPGTYEFMLIDRENGKFVYHLRHFGPGLVDKDKAPMVFDVHIRSDSEVVFEGRDSKRPSKLSYSFTSPDSLTIVLERVRDNKNLRDEFRMKRQG